MLNPTPLLNLLLASSAFVSVSAQADESENTPTAWGPDNYGGGSTGPFNTSMNEWNSHFDNPVATGSVSLPMPDLTSRYTDGALLMSNGSHTGAGWSLSIDLAEGLPVEGTDNVTTSVRISLNSPARGTAQDIDDTWSACVISWKLTEGTNTSSYMDMRQNDDCSGLLTADCIRDMEDYAIGQATSATCECPDPEAIDSCKGQEFPQWSTCHVDSIKRSGNGVSKNIWSYSGMPHPEGDLLGYNRTGYISWPVMVVWGQGSRRGSELTSSSSSSASMATPVSTNTGSGSRTVSSLSSVSSSFLLSGTVRPPIPSASINRRQGSGGYGNNSVARLSCLAVTEVREGATLPGRPVAQASGAGRLVEISSPILLIGGLVATYILTL